MKKALHIIQGTLMALSVMFALASCIDNDVRCIPYPTVEGNITAIEVEGQCDVTGTSYAPAIVNKERHKIELYVNDQVRLSRLLVKRLEVSNDARMQPLDSLVCADYNNFPAHGFASLDSLPATADTRIDFTHPVRLRLSTYQDYDWEIDVHQVINRDVQLEGQVGNAIIDDINHNVIIYVGQDIDLTHIRVLSFTLGGPHGKVVPDPTDTDGTMTYDFSHTCEFYVRQAWEEASQKWKVFVYNKNVSEVETSATAFATTNTVGISGSLPQSGMDFAIEYKKQEESAWSTVPLEQIQLQGRSFTCTLTGLTPGATYQWCTVTDGKPDKTQTFTTAPAQPLTDGDFDNWHSETTASGQLLWNPWNKSKEAFWDTGNRGATTVGKSNSCPTDETCNGMGQAALLESKYIVMKFAAGNIFTGRYKKTDGANGILDFGRPFSGFPTKLKVNYKYLTGIINKSNDDGYKEILGKNKELKGQPDSCQIYIALADWDKPYEIRTRPSERHLFNPKADGVIAYAQMTIGHDVPNWTQAELVLDYYYKDRTPKYILIVASSSKYGDFFTGYDGSKLWVDNFELIYD